MQNLSQYLDWNLVKNEALIYRWNEFNLITQIYIKYKRFLFYCMHKFINLF